MTNNYASAATPMSSNDLGPDETYALAVDLAHRIGSMAEGIGVMDAYLRGIAAEEKAVIAEITKKYSDENSEHYIGESQAARERTIRAEVAASEHIAGLQRDESQHREVRASEEARLQEVKRRQDAVVARMGYLSAMVILEAAQVNLEAAKLMPPKSVTINA